MPVYLDPDRTRLRTRPQIPMTFPLSEKRSGWSASCPPARSSHKLTISLLAAKNDPVTKTKTALTSSVPIPKLSLRRPTVSQRPTLTFFPES